MKKGYMRVSTEEQNLARQKALMIKEGIDKVYQDKASGKSINRPGLELLLKELEPGDYVYVESYSRVARNASDLLHIINEVQQKGCFFVSNKEQFDTTSTTGRFMITVLAGVAQMERELVLERQAEGIACAKKENKYKGGTRKKFDEDLFLKLVTDWTDKLITPEDAATQLGISRATFFRRVREVREEFKQKAF